MVSLVYLASIIGGAVTRDLIGGAGKCGKPTLMERSSSRYGTVPIENELIDNSSINKIENMKEEYRWTRDRHHAFNLAIL